MGDSPDPFYRPTRAASQALILFSISRGFAA